MKNKTEDKKGQATFKYPELGSKVKCLVTKSSFAQATLNIVEVDGMDAPVDYKAIMKGTAVREELYVCDRIKKGELVSCVVVSYGDHVIFVSRA